MIVAAFCTLQKRHRASVDREAALAAAAGIGIEALRQAATAMVAVGLDPKPDTIFAVLPLEVQRLWQEWEDQDRAARNERRRKGGATGRNATESPIQPAHAASGAGRPVSTVGASRTEPGAGGTTSGPIPRPELPRAAVRPTATLPVFDFRAGPTGVAGSDILVHALFRAHVEDTVTRDYEAGRPLPSEAQLRRVALRLRAAGYERHEVERALRTSRPGIAGEEAVRSAAVAEAFSEARSAWLAQRPGFVARATRLSERTETQVYRHLRNDALAQLKHDLEDVWRTQRERAADVTARHQHWIRWIEGIKWRSRRARRRGLVLAILSAAAEVAVLNPLIALQRATAARERQDLYEAAAKATARLKALRVEWRQNGGMRKKSLAQRGEPPAARSEPSPDMAAASFGQATVLRDAARRPIDVASGAPTRVTVAAASDAISLDAAEPDATVMGIAQAPAEPTTASPAERDRSSVCRTLVEEGALAPEARLSAGSLETVDARPRIEPAPGQHSVTASDKRQPATWSAATNQIATSPPLASSTPADAAAPTAPAAPESSAPAVEADPEAQREAPQSADGDLRGRRLEEQIRSDPPRAVEPAASALETSSLSERVAWTAASCRMMLLRAHYAAQLKDVRDDASERGAAPLSERLSLTLVAVRLNLVGRGKSEIGEIIAACAPSGDPERRAVRVESALRDAFAPAVIGKLRTGSTIVGRARKVGARVENALYRTMRRDLRMRLERDLLTAWAKPQTQAEIARHHARRLAILRDLPWTSLRLRRRGPALKTLSLMVEKSVLGRIAAEQPAMAAMDRQRLDIAMAEGSAKFERLRRHRRAEAEQQRLVAHYAVTLMARDAFSKDQARSLADLIQTNEARLTNTARELCRRRFGELEPKKVDTGLIAEFEAAVKRDAQTVGFAKLLDQMQAREQGRGQVDGFDITDRQ